MITNMNEISQYDYQSPFGILTIRASADWLHTVSYRVKDSGKENDKNSIIRETVKQLDEYFSGQRKVFSLPLYLENYTLFQKTVWRLLSEIPFGETRSYTYIARQAKRYSAARAVGNACGQNPFLLIIPCHRVIRADRSPGGFSAGLKLKHQLLKMERALLIHP